MFRRSIAASSMLLLAFAACGPAEEPAAEEEEQEYAVPTEDPREAYEGFVRSWFSRFNERNADGLAELYAEEAIRMPPEASAQRGREAIRAGFVEEFQRFSEIRSEGASQRVHFAGDYAMERGTYTFTGKLAEGGQELTERGKYVVVAQKGTDGSWQILWEIWNSNAPAERPTGETAAATGGGP